MICEPCKGQVHQNCADPFTCSCQHKPTVKMPDGTLAPMDSDAAKTFVESDGMKFDA